MKMLDFSHGEKFELEVLHCFGKSVHHPSSNPRGSFFLLVTFRRYLFRLTEESVALALQSCLGGFAPGFHVTELSHNHFRFSVSCKSVGFLVYGLRRFIGSSFDIYFHLWSNGVPRWEQEKRLWEAEEEKKWTKILSKGQTKSAKKQAKKVRFAETLVQSSPKAKATPPVFDYAPIRFGSFQVCKNPLVLTQGSLVFGSLNNGMKRLQSPSVDLSARSNDIDASCSMIPVCSDSDNLTKSLSLNSRPSNSNSQFNEFVGGRLWFYSSCLAVDHRIKTCKSKVRCLSYFNYGHVSRWCLMKRQPAIYWRPKLRPSLTALGSEAEETFIQNSVPSPNVAVSSGTTSFFKAHGSPITLELPKEKTNPSL